jgi:5-methylcytosine-specific restriction endonuclease McrA
MIHIIENKQLFNKHIENIVPKLLTNISKELSSATDATIRNCLNNINNNNEIKNILSITPSQMKLYIKWFKVNYPDSLIESSSLNKILKNIFEKEYKNWTKRTQYGAYKFVQKIGLHSCPYCNRNYTFTIVNKSGKMRPQIDHFYPKDTYPFLAMSFFNLIPSCPNCNHTKSNKFDDDLISPYNIKKNDFRFTFVPNSIDFIEVEKQKYDFDSFDIDIKGNEANIEMFKLRELYKQHKDIVLEILIKKAYYPHSYISELSSFGFSQDEIYRYLFCNYNEDKDLHKRPLSKLIKDISIELGI